MRGWQVSLAAVLIGGSLLPFACRHPSAGSASSLAPAKGAGMVYDTAHEAMLKSSGKPVPKLLEGVWDRYFETLAEPVAVTAWGEDRSTWEVFFATNRGEEATGREIDSGRDRVRFGNQVEESVQYGRAEVTIPGRRRGVDPAREKSKNAWRPWASGGPENVVAFESVETQASDEFLAGVRDQVERSRQKDVLVFVHGFNVDFDSAAVRTAQIALDMPFNGAVVCYAWPSQGGVANYRKDEPINAASVEPFREFLETLTDGLPPGTKINVVVHSMGNRIVLQAINGLPPGRPLHEVVLCAPDVGVGDFREWIPGVVARSERVTMYVCAGDAALVSSQVLHQEPRAGYTHPVCTADGLEVVDCSGVDFSFMGHSYYGSNVDVLADLFGVLKEHAPPERRTYLAEATGEGGAVHWRYAANAPALLWTWHFDHLSATSAASRIETQESSRR